MITVVLIFSLLLILVSFFAVFRRRLFLYPKSENDRLPPMPKATSLFAPTDEEMRLFEREENAKFLAERREEIQQNLVLRANAEDFTVLTEAKEIDDSELYQKLLDLLTEKIKLEPEKIEKFVAFVSQDDLPVKANLAEMVLAEWIKEPSTISLSKVLHVSALANSAEIYGQAIKTAVSLYQAGKLKPISANELVTALESHYWTLAREARISGAGFLLKEELASARREVLESSRK